MKGMKRLGFKSYLDASVQSDIITSFHFPKDPKFNFQEFYRNLSDKGFIIYPGKKREGIQPRSGDVKN